MTRGPARAVASGIVAAALGLLPGGCASDPTQGWSAVAPYPDRIETIAVPIAENDTFSRGLEFELTDATIKEIEARTRYKVNSQARADSVLLLHIREVELDTLSKSSFTGLSEEVLVGVTIDFQWLDMTTDAPLVTRESFRGYRLFVPSTPSGERLELGRNAVVQALARDVVSEMRSAW